MSREALLARAQAAAELAMVDRCWIRRQIGETRDEFSGDVDPVYGDVYGTETAPGRCRVQQRSTQPQSASAGEQAVLLLTVELQLPVSVTGVAGGDEVTIVESRDPDLVGRVLLVEGLAHKTDASSRRVQVTERTR